MLKQVNLNSWQKFISDANGQSLFTNTTYLGTLSAAFKLNTAFYIWYEEGLEILGFALLYKDKKVVSPTNFHTFKVVVNPNCKGDIEIVLRQSFFQLRDIYKSISLKFDADDSHHTELLTTIGFKVEKRFTFHKSLTKDLSYSRNITRVIKKGVDRSYSVTLSVQPQKSFELIWQSNRKFFSFANKQTLQNYYLSLFDHGFTDFFDIFKDNMHIASLLVIKDVAEMKAYTYLISIPNKANFAEAQTLLYTSSMLHYKTLGFKMCDLCGANIPSVALYKSKFNGKLVQYFQVNYAAGFWFKLLVSAKRLIVKFISNRRVG